MSQVIWMLGIGFSVAAMIVAAATKSFYIHMAIAAIVSILVALASFQEHREPATRADMALQASSCFRYIGLIWTWGAISLLATYSFILSWREWLPFFLGFFVMAGLCLFISATLRKDAEANSSDIGMAKIAYGLSLFFMFAMVIVMGGLVVDGKMWRFTKEAGLRLGSQDWAANNVFFFGAMAVAAISWNAFRTLRQE